MKKVSKLLLFFFVFIPFCAQGQVTIGSQDDPHAGAVLDLKSANRGLLLPRVSLDDINVFQLEETTGSTALMAEGMVVYNTNETVTGGQGKGIYIWDGTSWIDIASSGGNKGPVNSSSIGVVGFIPTVPVSGGTATVTLTTDCTTSGQWSVVLSIGDGYATLKNVDVNAGKFDVEFTANSLTTPRSAVVTVTDPCNTSKNISVTQLSDGTNPGTMETAIGQFAGRTCFDIASASVNDGANNCGSITNRASRKTDFTIRDEQTKDHAVSASSPYSGVQVYTFRPEGSVSNLRFSYVEEGIAGGMVIEKIEPREDYSGNIFASADLIVYFKESLNTTLRGMTRKNALKVHLYVTYNNAPWSAGDDITVRITLNLQDCSCCGAKTSAGKWLEFMCFNLGSNETEGDPFTYSEYILGDLYQWGRMADGHEKRTSATVANAAPTAELDGKGQVRSSSSRYGKFITTSATPYDWRNPQSSVLWGDGTQNETMSKSSSDPCPPGWKVPTQKQWASITGTANSWTWTNSGYKVGEALFLPAAGIRYYGNGSISYLGSYGYYWSSTISNTNSYHLYFGSTSVNPAGNYNRGNGMSVRCVSE